MVFANATHIARYSEPGRTRLVNTELAAKGGFTVLVEESNYCFEYSCDYREVCFTNRIVALIGDQNHYRAACIAFSWDAAQHFIAEMER